MAKVANGTTFPLLFLVFATLIVLGTRMTAASTDAGPRPTINTVLLIVVVALVSALAFGSVLRLAGYDADADQAAAVLAHDSIQERLIARWLNRMRWFRMVGGAAGVLAWLFSQGSLDLLASGTLGIVIGAICAESYQLRRTVGPRTATLDVRRLDTYLKRTDRTRMIVVGASGLLAAAVAALVGNHVGAVVAGLGAAAVVGLVHLVQRRVVSRGRPAIGAELRWADDLTRTIAVGPGLALPATYAALALDAAALGNLADNGTGNSNAAALISFAAWAYALVLWWRNRGLGLNRLPDRVNEVAIA